MIYVIDKVDKWLGKYRHLLTVRAIKEIRKIGYDATKKEKELENLKE